jgi:lipoprotein-releasing system permease protein
MYLDSLTLTEIEALPNVEKAGVYAKKGAVILARKELEGLMFKGLDSAYMNFISKRLSIEGACPSLNDSSISNDILMSERSAQLLQLKVGDKITALFMDEPIRKRRFRISGIYKTEIEEIDKLYFLGDIRHIQRLNQWNEEEIGGVELIAKEPLTEQSYQQLSRVLPSDVRIIPIQQQYPQIFEWLLLLDVNTQVIIVLMLIVALMNMISALFIIIIDKTNQIGVLKTLGMNNAQLKWIFWRIASKITLKGLMIGTALGLLLCYLQWQFRFIHLDANNYYMSFVPIKMDWWSVLGINAIAYVCNVGMMYLAVHFVSSIKPLKALRFK